MIVLYVLFIWLYSIGISIVALWNGKAAQWKAGRKNLWTDLEQTLRQAQDRPFSKPHAVIWIHSASAGEFEQAKPVIEALKETYPAYKILVTVFSPSGYPAAKKFSLADFVFYLPLDTAANAKRFLEIVQPKLVLFIKYDYWYHHLKAVHERGIPLLLVSAIFRKEQAFFKGYGGFYLSMLRFFTQLFVQDETSHGLLKKFGITNSTVAGDTRFDRVIQIANAFQPVPFLNEFVDGRSVVVAGSTWPDDERTLYAVLKSFAGLKLVLAPHEISEAHLKSVTQLFQKSILYSTVKNAAGESVKKSLKEADVLIIDNFGMLSKLYHYATITYIGGGFKKSGIHNTVEAAVFGKPVFFGPNYQKFREARGLLAAGGGFSYTDETELKNKLVRLLLQKATLNESSAAAYTYVHNNGGATETVMHFIQEKRLLTS